MMFVDVSSTFTRLDNITITQLKLVPADKSLGSKTTHVEYNHEVSQQFRRHCIQQRSHR